MTARPVEGTRYFSTTRGRVNKEIDMLPIIHIEELATKLNLERRWIVDHWITPYREAENKPWFKEGANIFFNLELLNEWTKRQSYGSDFTDTPIDPSD